MKGERCLLRHPPGKQMLNHKAMMNKSIQVMIKKCADIPKKTSHKNRKTTNPFRMINKATTIKFYQGNQKITIDQNPSKI